VPREIRGVRELNLIERLLVTLNCMNQSQKRSMEIVMKIMIYNKLRGGPSPNIPAISGGGVNSHVILRLL
jgi:hypothetical protein